MANHAADARLEDAHIDVSDYFDLRSWAKRFGVTAGEVRRAVSAVGDRAADVESRLQRSHPRIEASHDHPA
jgi:Protein of unknown function (DUF3606)